MQLSVIAQAPAPLPGLDRRPLELAFISSEPSLLIFSLQLTLKLALVRRGAQW